MNWKNININRNLIHYDTGKATLIAMPHESDYAEYMFWHPTKLVRDSFLGAYAANVGYNDEFIFRLIKCECGTKTVTKEIKLTATEWAEEFLTDVGLSGVTDEPELPLKNVPEIKEPIEPVVAKELKDD